MCPSIWRPRRIFTSATAREECANAARGIEVNGILGFFSVCLAAHTCHTHWLNLIPNYILNLNHTESLMFGFVCQLKLHVGPNKDFREWNDTTFAKLDGKLCVGAPCVGEKLNGLPGPECQCKDSYFGQPKLIGHAYTDAGCNAAPCNLANSNQLPGTRCACASGFVGNISWNGATPSGYCSPAECRVVNSTQAPGHQCRCSNGFNGSITWDGPEATGNCTAARCDVPHSNKEPGLSCECGDKYVA